MTKQEILAYEASNDFLLKGGGFTYQLILAHLLKIEWVSEFISNRLAKKVNKKWERYQEMKAIGDFLKK